ncbi:polysaccharide biosynthesis C-terminal domain-containing protein [Pseudonocardia oroxyli]|uniref:Membrane protein involved in the export of O-antigen and teichoic acid n=1 Tax=Pseudonocardia oroxyli TaxID=366584 RepID=A0A1G7ZBA1_PSEOR|nr:polysaccharide biosynthesis C-terminal domain-containing protein [Pseudonocardia oroxyli]SDH05806.1 Membrane protein involved in the export of O-antigen and teichoic acid [Pseudonocardia oroxyli]
MRFGRGNAPTTGSNIAQTVLGNGAAPVAAIVSAPILAAALGADGRGEVAASTAPVLLVLGIAAVGLPEAATYFIATRLGTSGKVLRFGSALAVASSTLVALLMVGLTPLMAAGDDDLKLLIVICLPAAIPGLVLGIVRGAAAGLSMWRVINLEKLLNATVRVAGLLILLSVGALTPMSASLLIAYGPAVAGIVYIRTWRSPDASQGDAFQVSTFMQFGLRVWLGSVAGVLLARLDQVLLIPLSNSMQLGFYAVAVNISDVPILISSAARDVMLSSDASARSDERLAMACRVTTLATLAVAGPLGISCPYWIPWLLGREFTPAILPTIVLLLGAVLGGPGSVVGASLTARGTPELRSYSLALALTVNIGILLIFVPSYGATAAAAATAAGLFVFTILNVVFLRKRYAVPVSLLCNFQRKDLRVITQLIRRR